MDVIFITDINCIFIIFGVGIRNGRGIQKVESPGPEAEEAVGEKLVRIYELVTEKTGLHGRLELAVKTGISMSKAVEVEDTEELVHRFKNAASDVYEAFCGKKRHN